MHESSGTARRGGAWTKHKALISISHRSPPASSGQSGAPTLSAASGEHPCFAGFASRMVHSSTKNYTNYKQQTIFFLTNHARLKPSWQQELTLSAPIHKFVCLTLWELTTFILAKTLALPMPSPTTQLNNAATGHGLGITTEPPPAVGVTSQT